MVWLKSIFLTYVVHAIYFCSSSIDCKKSVVCLNLPRKVICCCLFIPLLILQRPQLHLFSHYPFEKTECFYFFNCCHLTPAYCSALCSKATFSFNNSVTPFQLHRLIVTDHYLGNIYFIIYLVHWHRDSLMTQF